MDVIGRGAMTFLDAVDSNLLGEVDGGAQTCESGDIGAADALEALGANFHVVPAFGGNCVPHAVNHFVAHIKEATAFGRLQPFVWAGGVHVATEVVQVEFHHAGDVRTVHGTQNAFRTSQCTKLFCGQNHASKRGDVAEEDDARLRCDCVAKKVQHGGRIWH